MSFCIRGLDPAPFRPLFGLTDSDLAARGASRHVVDSDPGYPDRIGLRDMAIGEHAILLNYEHQPAATPYRSAHAIFIGEGAHRACEMIDAIPQVIRRRVISLRAFDAAGMIVDADLADGTDLMPLIAQFFDREDVAYLHAHYAKRGCYAARIDRV